MTLVETSGYIRLDILIILGGKYHFTTLFTHIAFFMFVIFIYMDKNMYVIYLKICLR